MPFFFLVAYSSGETEGGGTFPDETSWDAASEPPWAGTSPDCVMRTGTTTLAQERGWEEPATGLFAETDETDTHERVGAMTQEAGDFLTVAPLFLTR